MHTPACMFAANPFVQLRDFAEVHMTDQGTFMEVLGGPSDP